MSTEQFHEQKAFAEGRNSGRMLWPKVSATLSRRRFNQQKVISNVRKAGRHLERAGFEHRHDTEERHRTAEIIAKMENEILRDHYEFGMDPVILPEELVRLGKADWQSDVHRTQKDAQQLLEVSIPALFSELTIKLQTFPARVGYADVVSARVRNARSRYEAISSGRVSFDGTMRQLEVQLEILESANQIFKNLREHIAKAKKELHDPLPARERKALKRYMQQLQPYVKTVQVHGAKNTKVAGAVSRVGNQTKGLILAGKALQRGESALQQMQKDRRALRTQRKKLAGQLDARGWQSGKMRRFEKRRDGGDFVALYVSDSLIPEAAQEPALALGEDMRGSEGAGASYVS